MGLDTSHDCWHGAYSAFTRWRCQIAEAVGIPLDLMAGHCGNESFCWQEMLPDYYNKVIDREIKRWLPISWDVLKPDPIHILLHHSDCDGEIEWKDCKPLADRLKEILPGMPDGEAAGHIGNWKDKTQAFINGLMLAHEAKENVVFQ